MFRDTYEKRDVVKTLALKIVRLSGILRLSALTGMLNPHDIIGISRNERFRLTSVSIPMRRQPVAFPKSLRHIGGNAGPNLNLA